MTVKAFIVKRSESRTVLARYGRASEDIKGFITPYSQLNPSAQDEYVPILLSHSARLSPLTII